MGVIFLGLCKEKLKGRITPTMSVVTHDDELRDIYIGSTNKLSIADFLASVVVSTILI
jgi:hypothetical protein